MKVVWTCARETLAVIAPRDQRERLEKVIKIADERNGGYITVTIENVRKPRTTGDKSQNKHLNGHVQQLAGETGMEFEVIKMEIKHRALKRGYPILYNADGKIMFDLWGRARGISEADCSTVECGYLIEEAHQLAAELDIVLIEE